MPEAKRKVNYSRFPKKDFKAKDVAFTSAEVNGMAPGTKVEILDVQFGGAVVVCEVLNGPKHGSTARIKASDLSSEVIRGKIMDESGVRDKIAKV